MIKIMECFGGIGAPRKALQRLGIPFETVDYVEIDKYAVKSYNAMYLTNFEPQDIREWNKDIEVDMIFHGSPCQDFSLAGKQAGGDEGSGTRSSLLYETVRIVEKTRPKYVLWENVKNVISKKHRHNFDKYLQAMENLGYTNYYQVLNAKDFGIPQNRERVFCVSILGEHEPFNFPDKEVLTLRLKDMIEDKVDEKYYIKKVLNVKETTNYLQFSNSGKMQNTQAERLYFKDGLAPTLSSSNSNGDKSQIIELDKEEFKEYKSYITWKDNQGNYNTQCNRASKEDEVGLTVATIPGLSKVIINQSLRKNIKEIDKYCDYCSNKLERKRFNGRLEDFGVFNNRKYCNRECMQKGYLKIGENDQTYSNAHTSARKINTLILHKDTCEYCGGVQNLDIHHIDKNWKNNNFDNLESLCRRCHMKEHHSKEKVLRIRKLTPREVWRLMGFEDEDFDKASRVNSNAQLYKQAGNSIVVDVLEAIFKELLLKDTFSDLD